MRNVCLFLRFFVLFEVLFDCQSFLFEFFDAKRAGIIWVLDIILQYLNCVFYLINFFFTQYLLYPPLGLTFVSLRR